MFFFSWWKIYLFSQIFTYTSVNYAGQIIIELTVNSEFFEIQSIWKVSLLRISDRAWPQCTALECFEIKIPIYTN
jgi:hypothetical protein